MLYDAKRWDKTKTDPLSLDSFIAWLEKQPASKEYCYFDSADCLIAKWLRAQSIAHFSLSGKEVAMLFGGNGKEIIQDRPWTFGAALKRARKVAGK
jgi:hypothetical protein